MRSVKATQQATFSHARRTMTNLTINYDLLSTSMGSWLMTRLNLSMQMAGCHCSITMRC